MVKFLIVTAKNAGGPTMLNIERIDVILPTSWPEGGREVIGSSVWMQNSTEPVIVKETSEDLRQRLVEIGSFTP